MKTASACCALLFVLAGTVSAEMVYVVETTDFQKKASFAIMNAADKRALQKQIDAEARVFPKAMEQIRKEWDVKDPSAPPPPPPKPGEKREKPLATPPFPSGMLAPRKLEVKGEFTDQKKADKKREQCETRAFDNESKEQKRKQAAKDTKERDRELAAERAAGMLESKIAELIKNPAAGADAPKPALPPVPPAGGAGDKEKAAGAPK